MSARGSRNIEAQCLPFATRAAASVPKAIPYAALLFAALVVLALALAPRAEAYVYWAGGHGEPGTPEERRAIGRANLDGSGVKHDFVLLPRGARGLAVGDTHLYWTVGDPGEPVGDVGRASLDGTGVNQRLIADVDMSFGSGVAVDDEHVYWVSRFDDDDDPFQQPTPGTGAIGRANLDGTGVDESFITGLNFPAGAVAVDSSHLYWTSYLGIGRAKLDGTGVEENFIMFGPVGGLAVGAAHLWWTSPEPVYAIGRANLDGTGAESVIGPDDGFSLCGGGIAVDAAHVYWTETKYTPQEDAFTTFVGRAKIDGSRVNHEFIAAASDGWCGDPAVDALGPRPSNGFGFGKVKNNKRKGTATLTVKVPGPGELALAKSAKVKGKQKGADAAGKQKLAIKPKGRAKKRLAAAGKAKVKAKVTYVPDGGEPNTQTKRVRLVKR